jgi:hypothetical protein
MRLLRPKTGVGDELSRPIYRRQGAEALIAPCDASDRLCSKRLKPIIPVPSTALERHGHIAIEEAIPASPLVISPAASDRLLSEVRLAARGGHRRRGGFPVQR